jgi:hypothetical protein
VEKKVKKHGHGRKVCSAKDALTDDSSTVQSEMNVFDRLKDSQSREPMDFIATFQHKAIPEGKT